MKRLGIVLMLVLLLTGCSSAEDSEPEMDAAPSPTKSSAAQETEASPCVSVAQSTIESINVGIAGIDPANNITSAVALRAPERENVWLVAAIVNGEGLGETAGVWATNDDVTADPHSGSVFSVDGVAATISDWGSADFNVTEAGVTEVLECVVQ